MPTSLCKSEYRIFSAGTPSFKLGNLWNKQAKTYQHRANKGNMYKLTEYSFKLSPRQHLSNATMLTIAECEILHRLDLPMQIKCIWVWEYILVSVGRLVGGDYAFAGFDFLFSLIRISFFFGRRDAMPTWSLSEISTFATRRVARADAVWKRQSSSTNFGASDGSFFKSSSWDGCSRRVTTPYWTSQH